MMLRQLIVVGALFFAWPAQAQEGGGDITEAFSQLCSAVIDEKPDVGAIAVAHGMTGAGGLPTDAALKMGKIEMRFFQSSRNKHNIFVATTNFSDAREVE
jgi:hypothetical protein